MKNAPIYYSIGALLYCPANNASIVTSILAEKFGTSYSLALCLEDTISDNHVAQAEDVLLHSLTALFQSLETTSFFMPKLFIRVRNALQIESLVKRLGDARKLVTGFILPKLSPDNIGGYLQTLTSINSAYPQTFYAMPIMESPVLTDLRKRADVLYQLKERLDEAGELILNIRVGGNDLCHLFGFRRNQRESIHQILPVSNIFADIVTVFGMDYVISGPVWEYYDGAGWESGLRNELIQDKLCGFIGKTAIHPRQILPIRQAYAVPREDYEDAKSILCWNKDASSWVSGNLGKERMDEYKTHTNWARKILYLAEAYGIRQN